MRHFIAFLLSTVLLGSACFAQDATTLTDENVIARPGGGALILEDPSGDRNIRQVTAAGLAGFRPSREAVPNLGLTRSAIWVRFKVKNLTFSETWILQAAFPDMDNVELYVGDGPDWEVRELGQSLPFSSRRIFNRKLLFEVSLPFGKEVTFHLRYRNAAGMTLPLALYSSPRYQAHALGEQLAFGILFGFMLVLALHHLILYAKVREAGYLWYFLYITGYGLFQFSLYGLAHPYLWPGWTWWANHDIPFLLAFAFSCRILFTRSVRSLGRRMPASRYFLAASVCMVSGLLLYAGKTLGVLPSNFLTEYGMLFGSVGEMCLLFLGLGESIRAMKADAHEEQIRSMRLELELLKANIHPHFMFNSLHAAIVWIREDPATAERLLRALSGELRQLLKIVGERVIPMGEEIEICRAHLEVMSMRHDKRFALRVEEIRADEKIPPLVFHTLVENGLTHGYARKQEGEFVLSRNEDEKGVYYTLRNDGEAGSRGGPSGGLGLKYVRARLEEAFGGKWSLDSRAVPGGWAVTIALRKEADRVSVGAR